MEGRSDQSVAKQPSATARPSPTQEQLTISTTAWMGPLPPPETLAVYEQTMPGAADRIFKMTEQQAAHRQGLERTKLERDGRAQTRGQYLTAALAALLFVGSIWLISTGKDIAGLTMVIAETVALISVYMYGKSVQRKELDTKARALRPPR